MQSLIQRLSLVVAGLLFFAHLAPGWTWLKWAALIAFGIGMYLGAAEDALMEEQVQSFGGPHSLAERADRTALGATLRRAFGVGFVVIGLFGMGSGLV